MRPLKIALLALVALVVVLAGLWMMPVRLSDQQLAQRTDLPWQVTALADGTSQVLDLHLGVATLQDAAAKLGEPDNMALYVDKTGDRSLEVYFSSATLGPLKGTVIVSLDADPALLDAIESRSVGSERTAEGAVKRMLADQDKADASSRRIASLSYIPSYGGLNAEFFRERLGEPEAWREESDNAVSWFYPDRGLSLLIDTLGKDVFEFTPPRDFVLPADAVLASQQ